MANLRKIFKQLKKEKKRAQKEVDRLEDAISAFGRLMGKTGSRASAQTGKTVQRVRRKLSAAARKRIAAAQRARWAKWKQQVLKKVT